MNIVLSPDPILREVAEPVAVEDRSIRKLAKQMARLMYKDNGVGLAAPQVGVLKRLIVVDCGDPDGKRDPLYLVNPQIISHSDETWMGSEGCLSCPGISVQIERYRDITVHYTDLDGEDWEVDAGPDLFGRCLQHEIDHLNGMTLFERLGPVDRVEALKAYEMALAAGARPGDVSNPKEDDEEGDGEAEASTASASKQAEPSCGSSNEA